MDSKIKELVLLLALLQLCSSDTDSKRWVWSDASRRSDDKVYTGSLSNDRRYTGQIGGTGKPLFQPASSFGGDYQATNDRIRYEVNEGGFDRPSANRPPISPPEQYRPERPSNRPNNGFRPPVDINRPNDLGTQSFNRPVDNYSPINRPIENEYRPGGNGYRPDFRPQGTGFRPGSGGYRPSDGGYRPSDGGYRPSDGGYRPSDGGYRPVNGPNGRPVLTGPVPSWEQHNPHRYRDYDKCKCVHSFNCNTPGIKFGTCDIDKQYCCYKGGGHHVGNVGGSGLAHYERPRPTLAGPGGPIDRPGRPFQNKAVGSRPFGPFSEIDRYADNSYDLEEAYKKGLASAIYETYHRPNRYNDRDYQGYRDYYSEDRDYYVPGDLYKTHRQHSKYGLYDPYADHYYGRSANTTITALGTSKKN